MIGIRLGTAVVKFSGSAGRVIGEMGLGKMG